MNLNSNYMHYVLSLTVLIILNRVYNLSVILFVLLILIHLYLKNGFVSYTIINYYMKLIIENLFLGESRSLKELCRLTIRRYCFNSFNDGFKRLSSREFQSRLNNQLYRYVMFNKET